LIFNFNYGTEEHFNQIYIRNSDLCGRKIPSGEYYSKSIITGKITCSNCDKGILIKGNFLFFQNE